MHTIPRSAGLGLLGYGAGTAIAFLGSGSPGGGYDDAGITRYITGSHAVAGFTLWYVGALSALGLVVFGTGLRRIADQLRSLAIAAAATSVTGAFVSGGVLVAMAEGGEPVRTGVPHPVIYTITEIGNLLAVCAPALLVGVVAIVLAFRAGLPGWLRVFCLVAGICGVAAPFFFTYFVYLLWTVVAGATLAISRTRAPAPSLV
ncbi:MULTISPECIES: hypothetical protein [Kribbella]|uniref:DUF4386 family protein n=1 Tax=Kribbella karoonensis TaxID=324851 RepID=A0ABN2DW87_9ACTN